jgi:hypothetical protein
MTLSDDRHDTGRLLIGLIVFGFTASILSSTCVSRALAHAAFSYALFPIFFSSSSTMIRQ